VADDEPFQTAADADRQRLEAAEDLRAAVVVQRAT
jgi:hypothetical protein